MCAFSKHDAQSSMRSSIRWILPRIRVWLFVLSGSLPMTVSNSSFKIVIVLSCNVFLCSILIQEEWLLSYKTGYSKPNNSRKPNNKHYRNGVHALHNMFENWIRCKARIHIVNTRLFRKVKTGSKTFEWPTAKKTLQMTSKNTFVIALTTLWYKG